MIYNEEDNNYSLVRASHLDVDEKKTTTTTTTTTNNTKKKTNSRNCHTDCNTKHLIIVRIS